jgi:hypothetical protein
LETRLVGGPAAGEGSRAGEGPRTAEEYVEDSLELEFSDLDAAYYSTSPTVTELLERLLDNHSDVCIEIVA